MGCAKQCGHDPETLLTWDLNQQDIIRSGDCGGCKDEQGSLSVFDGSVALAQPISGATVTSMVRRALGCEAAEVIDWNVQQIHGGWSYGSAGGSGIHRVSGYRRTGAEPAEWSLILKVLSPPADRGQPNDLNYWRREAEAYDLGLLDDLPGGFTAPRCYGVMDQPDGECWIWLEDVIDDVGPQWPLGRYGVAARHLGQFNGAYLAGQRPIPSCPWLRHGGWLRAAASRRALEFTRLHDSLDHPLVRRAYPPDVVDILSHAWTEYEKIAEKLLPTLDCLPRTLCHHDAFRHNFLPDALQRVSSRLSLSTGPLWAEGGLDEISPCWWGTP
jgi:hypothetical protein